ncbi:MAG TPA: hypothetical protein VHW23_47655 [Kofleriaceae bacterium]|jgi:hypothetical protein|nr:hypothetical protein [Kofleriaceae bacterium]
MKLVSLTSISVPVAILCAILGAAGTASADIDREGLDRELPTLERSLVHPAPGPGLERASAGPPRWCGSVHARDVTWPSEIARKLELYRKGESRQDELQDAAIAVCSYNAPAYQHAATEVLQYWINETGLSEADAAASLAARVDTQTWEAEQEQLCQALQPDKAPDHEHGALIEARSQLFGCDGHANEAAWMKVRQGRLGGLYPYLDRGAMERDRDEIARLAWVLFEIEHIFDPREHPDQLGAYAVDQYDIHELAFAQAVRQLDAPPYRGSRFARTVLVETIGRAKLAIARIEAEVAKRAHDGVWKELLITVPQHAFAAWLDAADRHRDALARSDAMAAAIAAQDDAAHGCETKLRADLAPIIRPLARGDVKGATDRLAGDPLLGLLISRLAACVRFEGEDAPAWLLGGLAEELGSFNGPRAAAAAAVDDAAAGMKRAPFRLVSVMPEVEHHYIPRHMGGLRETPDGEPVRSSFDRLHVIQAMTPVRKQGAVKLTFVREREQYTAQECRETNKVNRVLPDGKVEYRQVCHDAGKATRDMTPEPITVPASCKAGLAVGRAVDLDRQLPTNVFADKTGKHLVAIHCLGLN